MRLAIIAMETANGGVKNPDYWQELKRGHFSHAADLQVIAIARHMRDGGRLAPMLICGKGTSLEDEARHYNLPHIAIKSIYSPADLFHLWNWQRKHSFILAVAVGQQSLDVARRFMRIRKKNSAKLITVFLLRHPEISRNSAKLISQCALCLCGSQYIQNRIQESLREFKQTAMPKFAVRAPGIELENYIPAFAWDVEKGAHFVFAMADSLQPRSGALLVTRAMSALWQKENLPPWEVRMFGSGPRFEEILEEANNLGVASRLSILGDQKLEEVSRLCHAWLAPGASPEEMPHTLWSGFAAGIPVICSHSEMHRERLAGAPHAALRVDQNNPQELARAMIGLMRDSRLRSRMINASLEERPLTGLGHMAEDICTLLEGFADEHGDLQNSTPGESDQAEKKENDSGENHSASGKTGAES